MCEKYCYLCAAVDFYGFDGVTCRVVYTWVE